MRLGIIPNSITNASNICQIYYRLKQIILILLEFKKKKKVIVSKTEEDFHGKYVEKILKNKTHINIIGEYFGILGRSQG